MSHHGNISPALRVPTEETIYCGPCDEIQPAYAHCRTRQLFCAVCGRAYDPDLIPEDYEPYVPTNYFNLDSTEHDGICTERL